LADSRLIFALDIGTRTVKGLVMETGPEPQILAVAKKEHRERTMLDGQIQDVEKVAGVVAEVKQELEQMLQMPLRKVAVAAAGRALITVRKKAEQDLSPWDEINEDQVACLELDAVRQAQQSLSEAGPARDRYYCVGYSIYAYYLDGKKIGNPVGQRGSSLGLELIATFLPCVVVDSLLAVLERNNLEMELLTLEPIAALEYAIPSTMRGLNLALVDIGAGTSDIAITAGGTVTAYAMVPLAGDEVTEKLCSLYLLDFLTGEKVKRKLTAKKTLSFQDVLGLKRRVDRAEIVASLKDAVHEIARRIGESIVELNGGPPQAVICIGGGSMTPGITGELAEYLGLSGERVAVRSADKVREVKGLSRDISGPDGVTLLGIAFMAMRPKALGLCQIQVNDRAVKLFRGAGTTIGEALLAADIKFSDLCGQPGRPLTVEVNGELRMIKGETGRPAPIYLNGEPARIDTVLPPNSVIKVGKPEPGRDAEALIADLLPQQEAPVKRITCNNKEYSLQYLIYMNGQVVAPSTPLLDRSRVTWRPVRTVRDALLAAGFSEEQIALRPVRITINGKPEELRRGAVSVRINGNSADLQDPIADGDALDFEPASVLRVRDLLTQKRIPHQGTGIKVFVNGEGIILRGGEMRILKNGREVNEDEVVEDGDEFCLEEGGYTPILADVFKYISFDQHPKRASSKLITLINGKEAQFTTPLKQGDKVRIYWKDGEAAVSDSKNKIGAVTR